MRIEHIVKDLREMSYEDQLEKIRQVREGRVMPIEPAKTKTRKRAAKTEDSIVASFNKMTPVEKEKFLEQYK